MSIMDLIALAASVILPLFNIPLIMKIIKRKSSEDISLTWVAGVWVCLVLMLPSGISSEDIIFRTFTIMNIIIFTIVAVVVLQFRNGKK